MIGVLAGALGLVVGLVIGTLGGGGGVLAVPALVYALGQDAGAATTGSIVIVGVISAVGLLSRLRDRTVEWRTGVAFGLVGVPTTWAGSLLNRAVPQPVLLLSFSVLTLGIAGLLLVRSRAAARTASPPRRDDPACGGGPSSPTGALTAPATRRTTSGHVAKVAGAGAVVGFLTGFLGVGGGFLVVPVLTLALGLPMPAAIATSLLVLTCNSVSSLAARIGHLDLDWAVIGPFVGVAVVGALIGKVVADRLSGGVLTRAFAVLLIAVGGFVGVESLLAVSAIG